MVAIKELREDLGGHASNIIGVNEREGAGPTSKTKLGAAFVTIVAIPKDYLGKTIFFNKNRFEKFKKSIIDQLPESEKYRSIFMAQIKEWVYLAGGWCLCTARWGLLEESSHPSNWSDAVMPSPLGIIPEGISLSNSSFQVEKVANAFLKVSDAFSWSSSLSFSSLDHMTIINNSDNLSIDTCRHSRAAWVHPLRHSSIAYPLRYSIAEMSATICRRASSLSTSFVAIRFWLRMQYGIWFVGSVHGSLYGIFSLSMKISTAGFHWTECFGTACFYWTECFGTSGFHWTECFRTAGFHWTECFGTEVSPNRVLSYIRFSLILEEVANENNLLPYAVPPRFYSFAKNFSDNWLDSGF